MFLFNFPAIADHLRPSPEKQIRKLAEESMEVGISFGEKSSVVTDDVAIELMDVIHCAETALRLYSGDVNEIRNRCYRKNFERGYYSK